MRLELFPPLNGALNGASAVLLLIGWTFIKRGRVTAHRNTMISAFGTSTAFLACYVTYHVLRAMRGIGVTRFPDSAIKPYYLALLLSHTVLAVVALPMILTTLYRAYHRQWVQHRKIARITFPVWLYVSVTGVIVYWMLYHVAPKLAHSFAQGGMS